jgi:hypothetical protein
LPVNEIAIYYDRWEGEGSLCSLQDTDRDFPSFPIDRNYTHSLSLYRVYLLEDPRPWRLQAHQLERKRCLHSSNERAPVLSLPKPRKKKNKMRFDSDIAKYGVSVVSPPVL